MAYETMERKEQIRIIEKAITYMPVINEVIEYCKRHNLSYHLEVCTFSSKELAFVITTNKRSQMYSLVKLVQSDNGKPVTGKRSLTWIKDGIKLKVVFDYESASHCTDKGINDCENCSCELTSYCQRIKCGACAKTYCENCNDGFCPYCGKGGKGCFYV